MPLLIEVTEIVLDRVALETPAEQPAQRDLDEEIERMLRRRRELELRVAAD